MGKQNKFLVIYDILLQEIHGFSSWGSIFLIPVILKCVSMKRVFSISIDIILNITCLKMS